MSTRRASGESGRTTSTCTYPTYLLHIVESHVAHRGGSAAPKVLRGLVGAVAEEHLDDLDLAVEAAAVERGPVVVTLDAGRMTWENKRTTVVQKTAQQTSDHVHV